MKRLVISLAALALTVTVAEAQLKRPAINLPIDPLHLNTEPAPPHLTGDLRKDVLALKARLDQTIMADLQYASLKAAAASTPGSAVRKQCWDAIIVVKKQLDGAELKDAAGVVIPRPDPAVFTDVEDIAEVIDALSTTGPLFTNCAGAAQLAKTSTLTLINTVVAGAAAFTAIAPIIP